MLGVQPDFLREEDVEAGRLAGYKVLYVTGQCLTRKASAKIDEWVKPGGVVYLSAAAATRDEFYEPHLPPFAAAVWPADAARKARETERPRLQRAASICRRSSRWQPCGWSPNRRQHPCVRSAVVSTCAKDCRRRVSLRGSRAAVRPPPWCPMERGACAAAGFLPGLAYSPFRPNQTTLDEVWPDGPRKVILHGIADRLAELRAVAASQPVVEANLLRGPKGSALVLVNYTYRPIERLTLRLRSAPPFREAISTEGERVEVERDGDAVRLTLPLKWTDMVILPAP